MVLSAFLYVCLYEHLFISFECLSGSGNVESPGNFVLNILRNCETVFPGSCTILHSHQQQTKILGFQFLRIFANIYFV